MSEPYMETATDSVRTVTVSVRDHKVGLSIWYGGVNHHTDIEPIFERPRGTHPATTLALNYKQIMDTARTLI